MAERATVESIGLTFKSAIGDEQAIADAVERMNEYLGAFTWDDGKCPCGRTLGGLLGSFTWGIVHGEGRCSSCGWPARGFHTADLGDVGTVELNIVMPYHESSVREEVKDGV